MKGFIKNLLPPILYNTLKKFKRKKYGWTGNYASWEMASKLSGGYDSKIILQKVEEATHKVISGEAAFERDSVLFSSPDYNWPLVSALMYVAAKNQGNMEVIDFGGSLGSTYFQNRIFFSRLKKIDWNVVEQEHFIRVGKKNFSTEKLHFFHSIEECLQEKEVKTILFSSVLQYLENPYRLLEEVMQTDIDTILIDRMPFHTKPENRICIQRVPADIYEASYPCHLLNYIEFIQFFKQNNFNLLVEYDALDGKTEEYQFKGLIFEK